MSAYIKIIYSPLFSCIWIPSLNERINQSRKNWTPAQSESRPVAILRNFWLWRNCYNSKNLEQGLPFWGLVHAHKAQIKHEKGNAGIHKKKNNTSVSYGNLLIVFQLSNVWTHNLPLENIRHDIKWNIRFPLNLKKCP